MRYYDLINFIMHTHWSKWINFIF